MARNFLEDRCRDEIPEVMESLLSDNQLLKDEKYVKQSDKSVKHSGKWFLRTIFVAIALVFLYFFSSNIYEQVSMQRPDSHSDSYHQYADQVDIENDTTGIQKIIDTIQKSSSDVEQFEMVTENYNSDSQRSMKEIRRTALSHVNFHTSSAFTATPTPLIAVTTKTVSDTVIATGTESSELLDKTMKTDMLSSRNIADNLLSIERSVYSEMSINRELLNSNNSKKIDPQFTGSNGENGVAISAPEFATNLQNLQITTISLPNFTSVYLQPKQENLTAINEKTDTEYEDEEYSYDYDDITQIISPATSSLISTITTITTATIIAIAPTSITVPQFTTTTQSNHHHRQYDYHDRQSPIIVTALFDIGRGKWPRYTRTYEQYLNYFKHLLKLRNRMVIYTDSRGAQFARQMRNTYNTQIFEMSIRDLPLHRYRDEMNEIIRREQEDWQFDPKMRHSPEANNADYNIIVNSKPYFLYNATQSARFRASNQIFAWIDAGYGHGREGIIPNHCHWRPNLRGDRITIIRLTPAHDKISRIANFFPALINQEIRFEYSITDLYRVNWVVISGGFIAGDSQTINRFYRFYQKSIMDLLDSGKIDDDQTVLTLMVKHYASLFNLIPGNGNWYAIFQIYPCYNR